MKVLVCGGRDFADYDLLKTVLSALHVTRGISIVIHGGATGADMLASRWAGTHMIPGGVYPADWKAHGKAAGPNSRKASSIPLSTICALLGAYGSLA